MARVESLFHTFVYSDILSKMQVQGNYLLSSRSTINILIYLNINQLDALNFIMSLFHASTCFEHEINSL